HVRIFRASESAQRRHVLKMNAFSANQFSKIIPKGSPWKILLLNLSNLSRTRKAYKNNIPTSSANALDAATEILDVLMPLLARRALKGHHHPPVQTPSEVLLHFDVGQFVIGLNRAICAHSEVLGSREATTHNRSDAFAGTEPGIKEDEVTLEDGAEDTLGF